MTLRLLKLTTLAIGALSVGACYSMRPITFDQLGVARPGAVWVTRTDESVVVIETPRVFGDTLVGYVNGEFRELPRAELNPQRMQVKRMAAGRTASLVVVSILGAGTFAFLVSSTGTGTDSAATRDCDDDPYQQGCPLALP